MINFNLNQMTIKVTDPALIKSFQDWVNSNSDIQTEITRVLATHFEGNDLWSADDGWTQAQPDRIVLDIPISVYPVRNQNPVEHESSILSAEEEIFG